MKCSLIQVMGHSTATDAVMQATLAWTLMHRPTAYYYLVILLHMPPAINHYSVMTIYCNVPHFKVVSSICRTFNPSHLRL